MTCIARERVGQAGCRHIVSADHQAALHYGDQFGNVLVVLTLDRGYLRVQGLHILGHEVVPDFEVVGVAEQIGLDLARAIQLELSEVVVLDVAKHTAAGMSGRYAGGLDE